LLADNIVGFLPESIDAVPRADREVAAGKNVGEVNQTKFIEANSCDLDIATDFAVHDG
jgi:hypothetical protein